MPSISNIYPSTINTHRRLTFAGNKDRNYAELRSNQQTDHATSDYFSSRTIADSHIDKVLKSFLNKDDIVLEIGCNRGNNLLPLGHKYRAYGLDLEKHFVDDVNSEAQSQGLGGRVQASQWDIAEDGSLPPEWPDLKGKCKAIYAVHTLSHFSDSGLKDIVQKLKPYLAPGGVFITTIIDPETKANADPEYRNWYNMLKNYMTDINGGFQSHKKSVVNDAFKDFHMLKEYSRPFEDGELQLWKLPQSRLRWAVYQLPQ